MGSYKCQFFVITTSSVACLSAFFHSRRTGHGAPAIIAMLMTHISIAVNKDHSRPKTFFMLCTLHSHALAEQFILHVLRRATLLAFVSITMHVSDGIQMRYLSTILDASELPAQAFLIARLNCRQTSRVTGKAFTVLFTILIARFCITFKDLSIRWYKCDLIAVDDIISAHHSPTVGKHTILVAFLGCASRRIAIDFGARLVAKLRCVAFQCIAIALIISEIILCKHPVTWGNRVESETTLTD